MSEKGLETSTEAGTRPGGKKMLSDVAKGAIFREVVLAKVRDAKEQEQALKVEKEAVEKEAEETKFSRLRSNGLGGHDMGFGCFSISS